MFIKTLYRFILKTFLPLFAMTFFIVLFIVLMQFLWRYIDDLVGKGLEFSVICELFFYAAVSMVPMALPLAILLASLMTFGNLGEKFELTAMKASGISLLRVMKPLIVLIAAISVGAFFFQNDVLPKAQVKMWTLLFSMRQKSPELEIPEGVFYDQIPGYNLFVREKDQQTGMLRGVMIYNVTEGAGSNSTILVADSARMAMAPDMTHLYLRLMTGEQFENLREQTMSDRNVPFRREHFFDKEILIPFDANFNRLDEQGMRDQYVGKNIAQLQATIDSVSLRLDSIGGEYAVSLKRYNVPLVGRTLPSQGGETTMNSEIKGLDIKTMLSTMETPRALELLRSAKASSSSRQAEFMAKAEVVAAEKKIIRRHGIEYYKKFTLSVACLLFFFIGAPLGAIIRKGGLGTPLVISILLFLFYYIVDNSGYKMARDGHWPVWAGMWLSSVVLAPLGIYATWKAMNDADLFDKDKLLNIIRKLLGTRPDRHVEFKEVVIDELPLSEAIEIVNTLSADARKLIPKVLHTRNYVNYWKGTFPKQELLSFAELLEDSVVKLTDCKDQQILSLLPKMPVIRYLRIYRPLGMKVAGIAAACIFPISIPIWLYARKCDNNLIRDLNIISGMVYVEA